MKQTKWRKSRLPKVPFRLPPVEYGEGRWKGVFVSHLFPKTMLRTLSKPTIQLLRHVGNRKFSPGSNFSLLYIPKHHSNPLLVRRNSGVSPPQNPNAPKVEPSTIGPFLKKYGRVALVFHLVLSFVDLAFWYWAVKNSLDIHAMLDYVGLGKLHEKVITSHHLTVQLNPKLGAFALALIAHKATTPLRLPITFAVSPFLAPRFNRYMEKWDKKWEEIRKTPEEPPFP